MNIVFATNNPNKIKEVQKLLPSNIELIGLKDIGCEDDIPETQHTIKGNSIQKVNYINSKYNLDCFADDTGLEISALNGDPGVLSARYAGSERNSKKNIDSFFSSQSFKFKEMVNSIRDTEKVLGLVSFQIPKKAKSSLNGKRSIYVVKKIKKGEILNDKNIKIIRPSYGLSPKYYDKVLGKKAKRNFDIGDRLKN